MEKKIGVILSILTILIFASGFSFGQGYDKGLIAGQELSRLSLSSFQSLLLDSPTIELNGDYNKLSDLNINAIQLDGQPIINLSGNTSNCSLTGNYFKSYYLEPDDLLIFKIIDKDGIIIECLQVIKEDK